MRSIFHSLELREKSSSSSSKVRQSLLGSCYFVEKFDRDPVFLEGHTGCVNSIVFSEYGSQIITASDDLKINFYDLDGEMVNHVNTIHTDNVFFAQDLPSSSSNEIVSCGADGRVVLSNVVKSKVGDTSFKTRLSVWDFILILASLRPAVAP
jgi:WD40 repeat protein